MNYKLGPFYLTTMTFPNPMFVQKVNDQEHPTTLAAIMTPAIYNTAEYRLAKRYKTYSVGALEWSRKTEEQRNEYVKKVLNSDIDTGGQPSQEQVITRKLSIDNLDSTFCQSSPQLLVKEGNVTCNCRQSQSTAGLCPHTLEWLKQWEIYPTTCQSSKQEIKRVEELFLVKSQNDQEKKQRERRREKGKTTSIPFQ